MKTFIYTITSKKHNVTSGSYTIIGKVYQIKKNTPKFITNFQWNTSTHTSDKSAIMTALAQLGDLPAKYENVFYNKFIANSVCKIIEV